MDNFTIVFFHGYTASHLADWYPNISKDLNKLGIKYVIPDLPGGEHPHAKVWLKTLHNAIFTLIHHSSLLVTVLEVEQLFFI